MEVGRKEGGRGREEGGKEGRKEGRGKERKEGRERERKMKKGVGGRREMKKENAEG